MNDQMNTSPSCDEVRQEIAALLYGELEAEMRAAVERHLDGCPSCRAEHAQQRQTMALLDHWLEPALPESPVAGVTKPEPAFPGRMRVFRLLRPLAYGAAAAVVLFGLLILLGAEARYRDGQITLTLGRGAPQADRHLDLLSDTQGAVQVRRLAGEECDQRIEELVGLLAEEFAELNRRQEQRQVLLARALDVQRARDRDTQMAALEVLARGVGRDSARQRRAIGNIYDLMDAGGVVPASHVEPQRKD